MYNIVLEKSIKRLTGPEQNVNITLLFLGIEADFAKLSYLRTRNLPSVSSEHFPEIIFLVFMLQTFDLHILYFRGGLFVALRPFM